MGTENSFLSKRIAIAAILVAVLLTPLPKNLGIYQFLFSFHPFFVGLAPALIASEEQWGFTFDDLYGDGEHIRGQRAIVTGANSGIGYEISLALARLGARVTMVCRNPTKCAAAADRIRADRVVRERSKSDNEQTINNELVTTMIADVSSLESVRKFSREFLARNADAQGHPLPLDMLFLNAGIAFPEKTEDGSLSLSEDGIEQVFATNVVGHHLLYKLLEPVLQRHPSRTTPARIVQTSSCMSYLINYPYKVATDLATLNSVSALDLDYNLYTQSKLAQILWVRELTARWDAEQKARPGNDGNSVVDPNSRMYANAANPGAVATPIYDDGASLATYTRIRLMIFGRPFKRLMWTPAEGALTLLYLGTAVDDLQAKQIRGQYYHPQTTRMPDHNLFRQDNEKQTKLLQEQLWKFLDELVADFL